MKNSIFIILVIIFSFAISLFLFDTYDYNSPRRLENGKNYFDVRVDPNSDGYVNSNMFLMDLSNKVSLSTKVIVNDSINYYTNDLCFLIGIDNKNECTNDDIKINTNWIDYKIFELNQFYIDKMVTRFSYVKTVENDSVIAETAKKHNLQIDFFDGKQSGFSIMVSNSTIVFILISFIILNLGIILLVLYRSKEISLKLIAGYDHFSLFYSLFGKQFFIGFGLAFLIDIIFVYLKYGFIDTLLLQCLFSGLIISALIVFIILVITYFININGNILSNLNGKKNKYILQVNSFIFKFILIVFTFTLLIFAYEGKNTFQEIFKHKNYLEYSHDMYSTIVTYNEDTSNEKTFDYINGKATAFYNETRSNTELESLMMHLKTINERDLANDFNPEEYYILTNNNYFDYIEIKDINGTKIVKESFDPNKVTLVVPSDFDINKLEFFLKLENNIIYYPSEQKTPFFFLEINKPYIDLDTMNMPLVILPDEYNMPEGFESLVAGPITMGHFFIKGNLEVINDILTNTESKQNISVQNIEDMYRSRFEMELGNFISNIVYVIMFFIISIILSIIIIISEIRSKARLIIMKRTAGYTTFSIYWSLYVKFILVLILASFYLLTNNIYRFSTNFFVFFIAYIILFLVFELIIIRVIEKEYIKKNTVNILKGEL